MIYYKIKDYISLLKEHNLIVDTNIPNILINRKIEYISCNSKDVKKDTLFICKGLKYKKEYLEEALNNGAILYVSEKENKTSDKPYIIVNDIRKSLAVLSNLYYNYPATKINMIGITGTKGKSTTTYYLKSILDTYMKSLGEKDTAINSSIDDYDGVEKKEALITSPESIDLLRSINNAVESNLKNYVMEVSSQALKLDRVYDINYDVAVFLNISEDHISEIEHPDFDDYFHSKLKIFSKCKNACINMDSDFYEEILESSKKVPNVLTFSTKNKKADVFAYDIKKVDLEVIRFKVRTPKFDREIELGMSGLFNVENALAAISVATVLDIPYLYIYEGLKNALASGRMEFHITKDKSIIAIVDYAHNKLSFEKLYESVKEEYPNKKIITVFGCPGGKAFLRRRDLGLLSGLNSDVTYLTAEDPGPEETYDICLEIAEYVKKNNGKYKIIEDRGEAIHSAIMENPDSVILITGKGNETRQKYGTTYVPCLTDTDYVLEAFKEYEAKEPIHT